MVLADVVVIVALFVLMFCVVFIYSLVCFLLFRGFLVCLGRGWFCCWIFVGGGGGCGFEGGGGRGGVVDVNIDGAGELVAITLWVNLKTLDSLEEQHCCLSEHEKVHNNFF